MFRRTALAALALLALTSLGALLLADRAVPVPSAVAAGGDKAIPRVTITVRESAIDVPATVPTGLVAVTFQNAGRLPLFAPLAGLNAGVTVAEVRTAILADDFAAFTRLVTAVGSALGTPPGQSQEVVLNLQPGIYVYFTFAEEGPTIATFQAMPPPAATEPPQAAGEIVMGDFFFRAPTIPAGTQTFQVTNTGQQFHHMIVARLALGVTLAEVFAMEEAGTDPLEAGLVMLVNGLSELSPGQAAWPTLSFTPGNYAMVCFVEDPATGQEHVELGMFLEFTVR